MKKFFKKAFSIKDKKSLFEYTSSMIFYGMRYINDPDVVEGFSEKYEGPWLFDSASYTRKEYLPIEEIDYDTVLTVEDKNCFRSRQVLHSNIFDLKGDTSIYNFHDWGNNAIEKFLTQYHDQFVVNIMLIDGNDSVSILCNVLGIMNYNKVKSMKEYISLYRENWEIYQQELVLKKLGENL